MKLHIAALVAFAAVASQTCVLANDTDVVDPTPVPTSAPSSYPSHSPTSKPTSTPSSSPTFAPTHKPTGEPTRSPTHSPTSSVPSPGPVIPPTPSPSKPPTHYPTPDPTLFPTITYAPTPKPTHDPTRGCSLLCEDSKEGLIEELQAQMSLLRYNVNRTVTEVEIEIAIITIEQKLLFTRELDERLGDVERDHDMLENAYRAALMSVGYSEDDIERELVLPRPEDTKLEAIKQTSSLMEAPDATTSTDKSDTGAHNRKYGVLSTGSAVFAVGLCAGLFFLGSFIESKRSDMFGTSQKRSEYQSI